MLKPFRLSFQSAGEIYAFERHADNTDKTAATRIRARFKPMPGAGIIRIVGTSARRMRELINRAAVNDAPLEISMPRPISDAALTPKKERFP